METKTEIVTGTIRFGKYVWQDENDATQMDMCSDGCGDFVVFEKREVEFKVEVPIGNDLTQARINQMKAEKQKTLADAQVKSEEIERCIQSLLALPAK